MFGLGLFVRLFCLSVLLAGRLKNYKKANAHSACMKALSEEFYTANQHKEHTMLQSTFSGLQCSRGQWGLSSFV